MTRWFTFHFEDVEYFRFSVYRFGSNVQTVYAYLLDDVLIDTGQSNSRENVWEAVKDKGIQRIILTHHHEDHSGNMAFLMKKLKAKGYAHPHAVEILKKGYKISPLAKAISGSVDKIELRPVEGNIVTENHILVPIYTPGHAEDHYCYHEPDKGWLFSGDLYVADKIKYFTDYEDIATQIRSLEMLCRLDFDALFCSHNPKTKNGKERLVSKLNHFKDFYGKVAELYGKGMDEKAIMKELDRKEHLFYKFITIGSFSSVNMVRSVIDDLKRKKLS